MFALPFVTQSIIGRISDKLRPEVAYPAPTPYKQPSNSVPHLFVDQQQKHSTREWVQLLSTSPSTYEHCRVVSLTWAKALESDLSHEVIQFIVEDTRNGVRTRVFSDRQNKGKTDHVILGWDWSGANNPSKQKDMPLPLKSLVFSANDRPSVLRLAHLLAAVTVRAPSYNIINMCWWYAWSVFDSAKAEFGGEVKEWPFARYAYKMIVWDYVVTPKYDMEYNARALKKQDVERCEYQTPAHTPKKELSTAAYLQKVSALLEDEAVQKAYEQALQVNGTETLDPKLNLDAFNAAWQRNMRAEKNIPADDGTKFLRTMDVYVGAAAEKKEEFELAMECFVGGVLRLLGQSEGEEVGT